MSIQITKVKTNDIAWSKAKTKYNEIYDLLIPMKADGDEVLKVELDEPVKYFGTAIYAKTKDFGFSVQVKRCDDVGKVWAIRKTKRNK